MGFTYFINISICLACLFLPPWKEFRQFIFPIFVDNLPLYGLLILIARKPHPQSMASLIVTCTVVCCDALLQFVLTTATQDVNLRVVTFEVFDRLKWLIFSIGFCWSVIIVDGATHITRTFVLTLPFFTTIVIFIFCQGAIIADQNLRTIRSILSLARLAPLPNSSHNLIFFQHRGVEFKSNPRDIKVWVSQSPGLIPVAPIAQKNGNLEYKLSKAKVTIASPKVKILLNK